MPRIRYLKPDFFKDEHIKDLPYEARLFYQGLWCYADKKGRLEDRPERLKVEIMPYDKIDIEKILNLLSSPKKNSNRPYILRYSVNKENYIQILQWHKHQKPHHTEQESIIPEPSKDILEPLNNGCLSVATQEGMGMEKGMEKIKSKGEDKDKEKIKIAFVSLWDKYPNKVGKKMALKHYEASVKTEEDIVLINKALENYLKSARVAKGFIQNASTWFCNYKDWIEYKEEICLKCKGSGIWTSTTGYENICSCPAGVRKRGKI